MTVDLRPLHEINRDGHAALVRELGIFGALRFLSQFTTGPGDYTAERVGFLGDESLKDLLDEIRTVDRKRSARLRSPQENSLLRRDPRGLTHRLESRMAASWWIIGGAFIMYLSELPIVADTDVEEQMIGRSPDLIHWSFEQTPYLDPAENEEIMSIYEVATAVVIPDSDNLVLDFYYTEPDGGYGCAQVLYSTENPTEQLDFPEYGVCSWGGIIAYDDQWLMAHGWEEPEAIHQYTAPITQFEGVHSGDKEIQDRTRGGEKADDRNHFPNQIGP